MEFEQQESEHDDIADLPLDRVQKILYPIDSGIQSSPNQDEIRKDSVD